MKDIQDSPAPLSSAEIEQLMADYQDMVKQCTALSRDAKRFQRQYKDLAFIVGFCVRALEATNKDFSTNAQKEGQIKLINRLLADGLNDVDLSNDGIPF